MSDKLNDKQKMFCKEYLIDLNGSQAAIRAGYSEKTANPQAARLLANVNIQSYIEELKSKRNARVGITADEVLENLRIGLEIAAGIRPHKMVIKNSMKGDSFHEEVELHKTDLNAYVKINDLYMKHLGMFEADNKQKKDDIQVNYYAPEKNKDN